MAIRLYPFGRAIGAVDQEQVNLVVQTITMSLKADDTLHMVHHDLSLWRDFLTQQERDDFYKMAEPHRNTIKKIQPADVWDAIERARPDLHAVLARNGGRPWLHAQAAELKIELLR